MLDLYQCKRAFRFTIYCTGVITIKLTLVDFYNKELTEGRRHHLTFG
jgi:hypothetical protein